jgi:Zn-finger protein
MRTMNISQLTNPENVIFMTTEEFVSGFADKTGVSDLEQEIEAFRLKPDKEGKSLIGVKHTAVRIFMPKLLFKKRFPQDDCLWVSIGDSHPYYCLQDMEPWMDKCYSFFTNSRCEYFPCHKGVSEEAFNCLFCYCPLYALKDRCGGRFRYIGNIKDCSGCTVPHQKKNYGYIVGRFAEIAEASKPD